jgi:hypothetical protein
MAFSGGTFSRTFDCTTDRDNGVKILASKFDTELDGFATGLSTCILKDGTQTCTAAIPFAEGLTVPDNKTIVLGTNSDITIQYDESTNDSLEIAANVEGAALGIVLKADQGDDNADQHKLNIADGGVLTLGSKISGSFVSYLTHTPNSTVASSTTAVAGNLTVGGDLTLGSGAVISEAELEAIDGVTAGTVTASKAVIVDSNKDIASFRNITTTGTVTGGSVVADNITIDGNTISSTDTNGNINITPNGTGAVAFTTNATFGDNDKANFGAGNDLQIYHNGSASIIQDVGSGDLFLAGDNNVTITNSDFSENKAKFISNGGAVLYYNNNPTVTVTSTGIDVTGTVTADGVESTCAAGDGNLALQAYHPTSTSARDIAKFQSDVGGTQVDQMIIGCDGNVDINGTVTADGLTVDSNGGGLTFSGGGNTFISATSSPLIFQTSSGTERMRITGTGRVGIGGTSPSQKFVVTNAGADNIVMAENSSASIQMFMQATGSTGSVGTLTNHPVQFLSNNTERMRLTSGGNVGIGEASPAAPLHISTGASTTAELRLTSNNTGSGSGDRGRIAVYSSRNDGTAYEAGRIEIDRSSGTEDKAHILFATNNGSGVAERLKIDSSGNVGISTSSPVSQMTLGGTSDLVFTQNGYGIAWGGNNGSPRIFGTSGGSLSFKHGGGSTAMTIDSSGTVLVGSTSFSEDGSTNSIKIHPDEILTGTTTTAANTHLGFSNPNGRVGSIITNGSGTAYNTSSDHRLKEAVVDMTGAIDRVKALAPKRFNFIADADTTVDGFLAHEAQAVVPEAVTGTHNEVDDDGNAVMQGIDQSKLVPLLTGALREAIAKIEDLETRLAALEGA